MKNVSAFLKRHSALLLLVLVLATVPAGVAFGKYVKSVNVTNGISIDVQMKEYRLIERLGGKIYSYGLKNPDKVIICKRSEVPSELTPVVSNKKAYDLRADDDSGSIYMYVDKTNSIVYIAPADSDAVIYAPADGERMFSVQNGTSGDLGFKVLDAHNLDTSRCTTMAYLFNNMRQVESIDLSGFDTSGVTNMNHMFFNCDALKSITFGGKFDSSNVTNMSSMFSTCKALTTLDISSLNTSSATNMSSLFSWSGQLRSITFGKLFNTSNVTDMNSMFCGCYALTSVDLSGFDTSNVTNMWQMFTSTKALETIDVSKFNTSKVTNMAEMFRSSGVTNLDLSSFDTSSVTNMNQMFSWAGSLKTINLSSFNTSNVTNMSSMFSNCGVTELDLSTFDTSNVTSMGSMFWSSHSLKKIYVTKGKFVTTGVPADSTLFGDNGSLEGGKGTHYNWSEGSGSVNYARIDNPPDEPGYFTDINAKYTQSATGSIEASGISLV